MSNDVITILGNARFLFVEQPFSELGVACNDIELVSRIEQATGASGVAVLKHPDARLDRFGALGIPSVDAGESQERFIEEHVELLHGVTLATIDAYEVFAPAEALGRDYRSILLERVAWGSFRQTRTPEDRETLAQLIASCNVDELRCFMPRSLTELDIVAKYCARRDGGAS